MVVGSLSATAVPELPPEAVTWFVTCAGALEATLTVAVIDGKLKPFDSTSLRVQVLEEQFHPAPDIEASVRPEGTFSVTVTVPLVGPPRLLTVTVY